MPIIIDANRAGDFTKPPQHHAPTILKRVSEKKMTVAVGGKLMQELAKTPIANYLMEWKRSGMVQIVPGPSIDAHQSACLSFALLSNDLHIVALARASGSRLLYSDDNALCADFRSGRALHPKGRVIRTSTPAKGAAKLMDSLG